jgi:hypothetical protein
MTEEGGCQEGDSAVSSTSTARLTSEAVLWIISFTSGFVLQVNIATKVKEIMRQSVKPAL